MVTFLRGAHGRVVCIRHYAISRKVTGSRPDEVNEFFSIYLILLALGFIQPLTEMSTKNRKIMCLGSRVQLGRRADNLTAIYMPIV
jgi:hypothetical protein